MSIPSFLSSHWSFQKDAEKMYDMLRAPNLAQQCVPRLGRCGLCGVSRKPFRMLSKGLDDTDDDRPGFVGDLREKVTSLIYC